MTCIVSSGALNSTHSLTPLYLYMTNNLTDTKSNPNPNLNSYPTTKHHASSAPSSFVILPRLHMVAQRVL